VAEKEEWNIILTRPAERVFDRSDKQLKVQLERCFKDLEKDALYGSSIKPLVGRLKGLLRYRIGDVRVIYRMIKESRIVEIIAILPRGDAY
jgi:mRNA-degrading endonuclease RelE of RelBE toxin-antitoxin system